MRSGSEEMATRIRWRYAVIMAAMFKEMQPMERPQRSRENGRQEPKANRREYHRKPILTHVR